ncbi:MAG: hypothetical protein L7U87_06350, partial [Chlamydiales bacterium]|nr:hypothetical protein [Chlamydiales bacterium]
ENYKMRKVKKTIAFCLVALLPFTGLSAANETRATDFNTESTDDVAQMESTGGTMGATAGVSTAVGVGAVAAAAAVAASSVSNAVSSASDGNAHGHSH